MNDIQKIITEYSPTYCLFLEKTYTSGMMSEGGTAAITQMIGNIDMTSKTVLDIGSGLGGLAFYLAESFDTRVTGLEINPWMTKEANSRTPDPIRDNVQFIHYEPPVLPFADNHFDGVVSKGVLVHVKEKTSLFAEIYRILKPNGKLIINDWLSPVKNTWGERIKQMCELEGLTLYAETEQNYSNLLSSAGFINVIMNDQNTYYEQYNRDIVKRIKTMTADEFDLPLWPGAHAEAIASYSDIADSMRDGELLVRRFVAEK